MKSFYRMVTILMLCVMPVSGTTGCALFGGGNGEVTQPSEQQIRDFVNFANSLLVLYGDKLGEEERELAEEALNGIQEKLDNGEDVDLAVIANDVIIPMVASKVLEDVETEQLEQIYLALTSIQLVLSNTTDPENETYQNVDATIERIKSIIDGILRERRMEEGRVEGKFIA